MTCCAMIGWKTSSIICVKTHLKLSSYCLSCVCFSVDKVFLTMKFVFYAPVLAGDKAVELWARTQNTPCSVFRIFIIFH